MTEVNSKPQEGEVIPPPPSEAPKSVLTDEDKREINLSVLTQKTEVMNPVEYAQMKKMANEFWSSNALGDSFQNVEQVIMALAAGREMGMGFVESINGLYFVKGRLNIYGKATPSALRRNGWSIRYTAETADSCTVEVRNVHTGETIADTFTFKEAEDSKFTTDSNGRLKPGWLPGANRKRKLRYGALSLIIHTYIPEVAGPTSGIGEYTQDYIDGSTVNKIAPSIIASEKRKADVEDALMQIGEVKSLDELRKLVVSLGNLMTEPSIIDAKNKKKAEFTNENS